MLSEKEGTGEEKKSTCSRTQGKGGRRGRKKEYLFHDQGKAGSTGTNIECGQL